MQSQHKNWLLAETQTGKAISIAQPTARTPSNPPNPSGFSTCSPKVSPRKAAPVPQTLSQLRCLPSFLIGYPTLPLLKEIKSPHSGLLPPSPILVDDDDDLLPVTETVSSHSSTLLLELKTFTPSLFTLIPEGTADDRLARYSGNPRFELEATSPITNYKEFRREFSGVEDC